MNTMTTESTLLQLVKITSDSERINALPKYFGKHFIQAENALFHFAKTLCKELFSDGNGTGYWEFYKIPNLEKSEENPSEFAFLAMPAAFLKHDKVKVTYAESGMSALLSPAAAALVIGIFSSSYIASRYESEKALDQWESLMAFRSVFSEAEQTLIYRLID